MDRQAREFLEVVGADRAAVEEIASDGSRAFYLFRNDDGSTCISSGPAEAKPRFGYTHCGRDVLRILPSADWPLYKEVAVTGGPGRGDVRSISVTGLVLPVISRVVFVDSDGTLVAEDDVEDHVFQLSMAPSTSLDDYAIVAYDDEDSEIHREPIVGRR